MKLWPLCDRSTLPVPEDLLAIFDPHWYTKDRTLPSGTNLVQHFLRSGGATGRNPCPLFDGKWYLEQYPDVRSSGVNPLVHYLEYGASEGRNPCSLFDTKWYLDRYPDVAAAGVSPLVHYLTAGVAEYRMPSPMISDRLFSSEEPSKDPNFEAILYLFRKVHRPVPLPVHNLAGLGKPVPSIDLAVHAHIFHAELAQELIGYLANIPQGFTLYVSTDSEEKKVDILDCLSSSLHHAWNFHVEVTENRGRDLGPMVLCFAGRLQQHELVLHIHTKRSPHNIKLVGWRRYLLDAVLGSPDTVKAIISRFQMAGDLGLMYPAPYFPVQSLLRSESNGDRISTLRARVEPNLPHADGFPAGSMFWIRGRVFKVINHLHLSRTDFEDEANQIDGTLAHALERLFPSLAAGAGLRSSAYLPSFMYNPDVLGARPIDTIGHVSVAAAELPWWLIIDHDIGGGANVYTRQLIELARTTGRGIWRLFASSATNSILVQAIQPDDGAYYSAPAIESVFQQLQGQNVERLIVNSLHGFLNPPAVAIQIANWAEAQAVDLEFKVHDFFSLCPSQHLMNFNDQYCGVPHDQVICRACLPRNRHIAAPVDSLCGTETWRRDFRQFLAKCNTITCFHESGRDLLQASLDLAQLPVRIVPHDARHFTRPPDFAVPLERLHVFTVGTITRMKGLAQLDQLSLWIQQQELDVPVTLFGEAIEPLNPGVHVTGAYENAALPELIQQKGANACFLSSIIPETFCYALSEMIALRIPVVCYDLGAQGDRVRKYSLGRAIPLGSPPEVVFSALEEVWQLARIGTNQ